MPLNRGHIGGFINQPLLVGRGGQVCVYQTVGGIGSGSTSAASTNPDGFDELSRRD